MFEFGTKQQQLATQRTIERTNLEIFASQYMNVCVLTRPPSQHEGVICNDVFGPCCLGHWTRVGGRGRSDVPRRHLCLRTAAGRGGLIGRQMGQTFFRG